MAKIVDDDVDSYFRNMMDSEDCFDLDADDQRDLLHSYFRLRDELVPAAMEAYRAVMGDAFDADYASVIPDIIRAHFGDVEGWYYE